MRVPSSSDHIYACARQFTMNLRYVFNNCANCAFDLVRDLLGLPPRLGGVGISDPSGQSIAASLPLLESLLLWSTLFMLNAFTTPTSVLRPNSQLRK